MLLLVSIGLSLALGKNGLVEKAITGKQEARKSEAHFKVIQNAGDIVAKGQEENLSTEEIDKKLDEYFSKPEVQKELENIQKDNGFDSIEEAKEKVLRDIGWTANTSSKLPPIKDEDRKPMILSMDLTPNVKLAVSQFPENCYVDWGDGIKSRSLQSTQTGLKDVKIYGNFYGANLGWNYEDYGERLNYYIEMYTITGVKHKISTTEEEMRPFNNSIIEIKDWGENNFKVLSLYDTPRLTSYVTPRERSFENLEQVFGLFSDYKEKIDPNLFAHAPNLKTCVLSFFNYDKEIPDELFAHCPNLEYVYNCFIDQTSSKSYNDIFSNNSKLKFLINEFGAPVNLNERSFVNHPELEVLVLKVSGNISKNIFKNSNKLQYIELAAAEEIPLPAYMFKNVPNLKKVALYNGWTGPIPENLFANNPNLEKVSFLGCTGLTGAIPEKLFVNNQKLTNMQSCFSSCEGLTGSIPENLFANNPNLINASFCFSSCEGLTGAIPENLFANNPKLQNVKDCFNGCTGLTGIAPKFWEKLPKVGSNYRGIYRGCTNLSNYNELPERTKN